MDNVVIDEHAFKHGMVQEDIEHAWVHFVALQHRGAPNEGEIVVVGVDTHGKLVQLVAA